MSTTGIVRSTQTLFGTDSVAELPSVLKRLGARRALTITGPSRRFLERIQSAIAGIEHAVYDRARVHVPENLVIEAAALVDRFSPDTLIALGGGAAIGLGKALRLRYDTGFIAVPTTYAGSEMTALYGVTSGASKQTGRDDRVRPDVVIYDPAFTAGIPPLLATQSLLNALAHPVSALSTGRLQAGAKDQALDAARHVYGAVSRLATEPESEAARLAAMQGASLAGRVLDRAELGLHHKLAHLLGGHFGLDHAGLHSVLLPHSVALLHRQNPELYAELARALGVADVAAALFARLQGVGAPTSLAALGASPSEFAALVASQPAEAAELLERAFRGQAALA